MRLLHVSTFKLVNKHENELPPYAILSHTWGNDEDEVTLQDMQSLTASNSENTVTSPVLLKKGFAKIRQAARLAQYQGLDYFWVDTCCIDKTSSAELSEAINSMFRWYQGSTACYALLSDVKGSGNSVTSGDARLLSFDETFVQELRSSRWFKRGWTLQELLAPSSVQFYSQSWSFIGTKKTTGLQHLISDITGIATGILDGSRSLLDLSIANRMQWASGRQTTRSEDLAYCLMGVFEVNMPLLYGEGMKAFLRLEEEILKGSNDQSFFAWVATAEYPAPASGLSGLLAPSPACFKNSGHINPLPPDASVISTPSEMTNVGLQIHFNLSPSGTDPSEFNAILDCAPYDAEGEILGDICRAAIRITALGGNQYARLSSNQIFAIPAFKVERRTDHEYKEVFVRQQPILLLPDIVFSGLNTIDPLSMYIIAGWPHNQWNSASQKIRPGISQREGVVAGFRIRVTKDSSQLTETDKSTTHLFATNETITHSFLDVFVGLSVASTGVASWAPWCGMNESGIEQPLEASMLHMQAQTSDASTKKTELYYGRDSRPEVLFRVSRDHRQGKGQVTLTAEKIHELGASVPRTFTYNPLPAEYESLAGSIVVEESARTELNNLYSSTYGIRVREKNGQPVCQQSLSLIRHRISTSLDDLSDLRPNQSTPDTFEYHFSKILIRKCIKNDVAAVKHLLCSPLSTALINAWTSEVRTSFDGLDPHSLLKDFRPLHWATLFNCIPAIKVLLEHGADMMQETWTGLTALHLAIVMGHFEILEHMFAVQLNSTGSDSRPHVSLCDTLPNFASSFIRSEQVAYILDMLSKVTELEGSDSSFGKPNILGETILHRAAAVDNIHAARWALRWSPELIDLQDKRGRTPLFHAAAGGSFEVCQFLITKGASIDIEDKLHRLALHAACRHGHDWFVDLLFGMKTTFQMTTDIPLNMWHFATLSENHETLRALKPYKDTFGRTGERVFEENHDSLPTPLHIASSNGLLECVKVLCETGFVVNATSQYSLSLETLDSGEVHVQVDESDVPKTAEEWAVVAGHPDVAEYLRAWRI